MHGNIIYSSVSHTRCRLDIDGFLHTFQPGELLLGLLSISEANIKQILASLSHTISCCDEFNLRECISTCKKIFSLFDEAWQSELFTLISAARIVRQANDDFNQVALTPHEQTAFFQGALETSNSREKEIRKAGNDVAKWDYWLQFLADKMTLDNPYHFRFAMDMENILLSVAKQHLEALEKTLIELTKLQPDIIICLDDITDKNYRFPQNHWCVVSLSNISSSIDINALNSTSKNYNCYSLTEIAALDIYFLYHSKCRIRHCGLCKRLFLAASSVQRFCSQPNADYSGKPCKKVGPLMDYRQRVDNDDVLKRYEKNYKAYHGWVMTAQRKLKAAEDSSERIKEIIKNIQDIYNQWCTGAQQVRTKWLKQTISYKDAMNSLKLPIVEDRSSMYYDWCQDQRRKAGLI